ncbi:Chalcone isomerase, partial [Cynara cardunculus var. scolymus]
MGSLRFPFSFSQPATTRFPSGAFSPGSIACSVAVSAAIGAGISAGISISQNSTNPSLHSALNSFLSNFSRSSPLWGSLSLSDSSAAVVTESKTGFSFPAVLKDSQGLLGIGLRRKAVFGLKNIDVYAFGVYADDNDIKNFLSEKYGTLLTNELKQKEVTQDLMESDISVTVRLQIVYGKLSIRSVRNAFEDSVGSRLKKFGGSENKELLQKFTSQFSDEYKIPRGSIIDLSKEKGYVLRTTIDGKEVGSVQSQLLCRSILDLYIGDE